MTNIPICGACFHTHKYGMYCGTNHLPVEIYQQEDCSCGIDFVSDCRSENGITVGLIDGMIAMARIVAKRDLSSTEVQEALKDLGQDEDLNFILKKAS